MATKNTRGANVGSGNSSVGIVQISDQLPEAAVLVKTFTTTGATAAVQIPSGISGAQIIAPTSGGPTSANVVVEGSNDGSTWFTIPAPAGGAASARYTQVRLNCTALAGGTSPAIYVSAIVTP